MIDKQRPVLMLYDKDSGIYLPHYAGGLNLLLLPSEIDELINSLLDYKESYTDSEIKNYNVETENYCFNTYVSKDKSKSKNKSAGYVYLLKCYDAYKVGFSTDTERRIRELDTRPFKLTLVATYYSDSAYEVEQLVHKQLSRYQVTNEWYRGIDEDSIKQIIEEIICDIQS